MTPLRIIHVVPRVVAESSGPSHTVPHLCRSLADLGAEVELKVLEPLPGRTLPFPATAYPTLPLPGAYRLGVSPSLARALEAQADTVDIIHSHSLWMMPNIYPGQAIRRGGCKLVISPRGTLGTWAWQRSRWRKALVWRLGQRATLEAADLLHATASSEYEAIRGRGLRQPVAVIPNGVEIPDAIPLGKGTDTGRTLLFLSRIHPTKQVDRLLRVWHRLESLYLDWSLTIAGPLGTSYAMGMKDLARSLALRRVSFAGELSGQAKWQAYGNADLFVLPTHSENFGLAIAEALAAGTPVITTRGAPWPGLETHGCGWWIADDEAALEATLRQAMARPVAELAAMGERGRAWIERDFSWAHVAERMAASYRWLLGRGDRPDCVLD
jgi:glycosyltransferase involved in cell wall biosynthesis